MPGNVPRVLRTRLSQLGVSKKSPPAGNLNSRNSLNHVKSNKESITRARGVARPQKLAGEQPSVARHPSIPLVAQGKTKTQHSPKTLLILHGHTRTYAHTLVYLYTPSTASSSRDEKYTGLCWTLPLGLLEPVPPSRDSPRGPQQPKQKVCKRGEI